MHKTCMPVYIFEGPDGGGKSTAVSKFSKMIGAEVVHCGPFPGVQTNLARFYVEAMMPALLGHRAVILDRSWLSEAIYGAAFRKGQTRIDPIEEQMLNRLAARCGAFIFACMPPKSVVTENFLSRKGDEYLDRVDQLHDVYDRYELVFQKMDDEGDLDVVDFDYTQFKFSDMISDLACGDGVIGWTRPHLIDQPTIGSSSANIVIIGDGLSSPHSDFDTFKQFAFTGFDRMSDHYWLARQLYFARERVLLVDSSANMDMVNDWLLDSGRSVSVICLGASTLVENFRGDVQFISSVEYQRSNQEEGMMNATISAIRCAAANTGVARATPQDPG